MIGNQQPVHNLKLAVSVKKQEGRHLDIHGLLRPVRNLKLALSVAQQAGNGERGRERETDSTRGPIISVKFMGTYTFVLDDTNISVGTR